MDGIADLQLPGITMPLRPETKKKLFYIVYS